jgi:hypothetical protein
VSNAQSSVDQQRAALKQRWLRQAREAGESDSYTGKRRQARLTWQAQLEVKVASAGGGTETHIATACDISTEGIGLLCRQKLELFSKIEITPPGEAVGPLAVVRQCTPTLNAYLVGAAFEK